MSDKNNRRIVFERAWLSPMLELLDRAVLQELYAVVPYDEIKDEHGRLCRQVQIDATEIARRLDVALSTVQRSTGRLRRFGILDISSRHGTKWPRYRVYPVSPRIFEIKDGVPTLTATVLMPGRHTSLTTHEEPAHRTAVSYEQSISGDPHTSPVTHDDCSHTSPVTSSYLAGEVASIQEHKNGSQERVTLAREAETVGISTATVARALLEYSTGFVGRAIKAVRRKKPRDPDAYFMQTLLNMKAGTGSSNGKPGLKSLKQLIGE